MKPPNMFRKNSVLIHQIHVKTIVPESLFLLKLQVEACNFMKKKDSDKGFLWTWRKF